MSDNDIIYKHNQRTIIEQGKRQDKDFEFTSQNEPTQHQARTSQ